MISTIEIFHQKAYQFNAVHYMEKFLKKIKKTDPTFKSNHYSVTLYHTTADNNLSTKYFEKQDLYVYLELHCIINLVLIKAWML